jgi:hypothetical protein
MTDRIRTLLFYAHSVPHWRRIVADTLVGGLRLTPEMVPARWRHHRRVQFLFAEEYQTLSYLVDWKEAVCDSPDLDVHPCNINNLFEYRAGLRRLREFPLSIILHSAAGDDLASLRRCAAAFQARRGILMICFGNEYSRMRDKIGFAREVEAEYIVSQLPWKTAQWLYADCPRSQVLSCPAALNPRLYRSSRVDRPIDIGFRGDLYEHQYALGDMERTEVLHRVQEEAARTGLATDIQYLRYPREEWSRFLNRCKGIIGAESGTSYLERDDRTREAVIGYLKAHPHHGFPEVFDRFFRQYPNPVSGKAISSRHFEPIGTKTCQILLEGHYNGILKPDEHYISIKKDYSNLAEAICRFRDEDYRRAMVERTYEYAVAEHTYRHRVQSLIAAANGRIRTC